MLQQQSSPGHLAAYLTLRAIVWRAGNIQNVCASTFTEHYMAITLTKAMLGTTALVTWYFLNPSILLLLLLMLPSLLPPKAASVEDTRYVHGRREELAP